ncbi:cupin domain-containing protein [Glaciimonas soli]|uniref:Cupin domain-containing protein n=1 Tax=Glaciimonas soli TaxID=2590999 RepID=A0A843YMF7_9BURK|nr:cupin domain-containing protein [Glaciimonas soli]MQR00090.1 cupin domain-containing protein [Glaciimonas soli]
MSDKIHPIAIVASEADLRKRLSNYPEPFAALMAGREKRPLGDIFGLTNFGVNLTQLSPNAVSALRHWHSKQDEFIYILSGYPTLITDEGETELCPGMCSGFRAASGNGHVLVNRTLDDVIYLEIGDRTTGDSVTYPDDDLQAALVEGGLQFLHKDGMPY